MFDLPHYQSRSADNSIRMFDRRNLTSNGVGSPIHKFEAHKAAVLCVQVIYLIHSFCLLIIFYVFWHFIYIIVMSHHMLISVCLIQWSPDKSSVFGSSAEDGLLNIWDYEKVQF